MSLLAYHPEMGESRPVAKIDARLSHYGKHYFLKVSPDGPTFSGRGVKYEGVLTAERLVPGSKFVGWHEYTVTVAAFAKIKREFDVAYEMLLD